mgnify:CR=1 FL=1
MPLFQICDYFPSYILCHLPYHCSVPHVVHVHMITPPSQASVALACADGSVYSVGHGRGTAGDLAGVLALNLVTPTADISASALPDFAASAKGKRICYYYFFDFFLFCFAFVCVIKYFFNSIPPLTHAHTNTRCNNP